ncbi:MAG: hypothetical protein AAGU26_05880 [bacterium]|jgi:hypothetical protein
MGKVSGLWLFSIPLAFLLGFIACALLVRSEDPPILAIKKNPKEKAL